MFCTNCGKEFSDGSNFCPHCGTPAVKDESGTVPSVSGTVVPEETAFSGKQPSAAVRPAASGAALRLFQIRHYPSHTAEMPNAP